LRLLSGLYQPDRIAIAIDGVAQPGLTDLGAVATLLPQEPEIFESTIAHNLTLGLEHDPAALRRAAILPASRRCWPAARPASRRKFSERGVNLSGGQKQRLALARGILAAGNSALLMLDRADQQRRSGDRGEDLRSPARRFPDACLVPPSPPDLLGALRSHRADGRGRIVDTGSLAELLGRQPGFAALWRRSVSRRARSRHECC